MDFVGATLVVALSIMSRKPNSFHKDNENIGFKANIFLPCSYSEFLLLYTYYFFLTGGLFTG